MDFPPTGLRTIQYSSTPLPPRAEFQHSEIQAGILLPPLVNFLHSLSEPAQMIKLNNILDQYRTPQSHHRVDIRMVNNAEIPWEDEDEYKDVIEAEEGAPVILPPEEEADLDFPKDCPVPPRMDLLEPKGPPTRIRELRLDIRTLDPGALSALEDWRKEVMGLDKLEMEVPDSKCYQSKKKTKKTKKTMKTARAKRKSSISQSQPEVMEDSLPALDLPDLIMDDWPAEEEYIGNDTIMDAINALGRLYSDPSQAWLQDDVGDFQIDGLPEESPVDLPKEPTVDEEAEQLVTHSTEETLLRKSSRKKIPSCRLSGFEIANKPKREQIDDTTSRPLPAFPQQFGESSGHSTSKEKVRKTRTSMTGLEGLRDVNPESVEPSGPNQSVASTIRTSPIRSPRTKASLSPRTPTVVRSRHEDPSPSSSRRTMRKSDAAMESGDITDILPILSSPALSSPATEMTLLSHRIIRSGTADSSGVIGQANKRRRKSTSNDVVPLAKPNLPISPESLVVAGEEKDPRSAEDSQVAATLESPDRRTPRRDSSSHDESTAPIVDDISEDDDAVEWLLLKGL